MYRTSAAMPASGNIDAINRPSVVRTLCRWGDDSSDKSGCIHFAPPEQEGSFLQHNDAIEDGFVSVRCTIFFKLQKNFGT